MVQGEGCVMHSGAWASLDQSESKRVGFVSLQKKCQADQQRKISTHQSTAWMGNKAAAVANKTWGSRDVDQFKKIHNF